MNEVLFDRAHRDQRLHHILELLEKLENAGSEPVQRIIDSVKEMEEYLRVSDRQALEYEERVNGILEALLKFTLMNFSEPASVSEAGDELDAIALGINTLAEELQDKIATERQNAERLHEQNIKLERTNKELASFAYVSSHDLQEPLRKINTYISRILDEGVNNVPEEIRFYLDRIKSSASRMQNLIRDILEYSKLTTQDDEIEITGLAEVVRDVKAEFDEILKEHKATLEYDIDCQVKIVAFQFRQIITNLLGNSIKFRSEKRPLKISITSSVENGKDLKHLKLLRSKKYCHIRYSDNGIGFENEYNEKIFEVFQRLHSQSDYQGTGVGLSICKRIVENHGGAITAQGEVDKGAAFDIYLPLAT